MFVKTFLAALLLALSFSIAAFAQQDSSLPYKSQELADDGLPVLIKHLPNWENLRDKTTFAKNTDELRSALRQQPIIDLIDFSAGTEAVTAPYDEGRLLIVEHSSPQASIEADEAFVKALGSGKTTTVYRRIGNYNAFVFDATDMAAANALLDQVKYEKSVQWLGKNPFIISAERAFVLTTADIFVSTVLIIVFGIGFAVLFGVIVGFVFFSLRERRRSGLGAFSDAGGMTRLNLDGYTPEIFSKGLLKD